MHSFRSSLTFILLLTATLFTCKDKGILPNPIFPEKNWEAELENYEKLFEKEPTFNNFQSGILKISNMLIDTVFQDDRKDILLKGVSWCEKNNNVIYALVFKKEFVKAFPKDLKTRDFLLEIVKNMDEDAQELDVKIIYDGILKRWPDSKSARENWSRIKRDPSEFDFFLRETGNKMFGSKDKFVIDSARVDQFISLSEAFALAYPDNPRSIGILMTAAQTAQTGKRGAKAVEIFDWVWRYFPSSKEAPLALFLKGFVYETELNQKAFAIDAYKTFQLKYPGHERKKEVDFLLENIHASQEELIKKLENQ